MKQTLLLMLLLSLTFSCKKSAFQPDQPNAQQQEVEATIVEFDYTKYICGYSWIIQAGTRQYRAKTVPEAYQKPNQLVWVKYDKEPDTGANCEFITLTAIRVR